MNNIIITVPATDALALPAPGAASIASATQLLAYLSPLFPGVASMARTEAGATGWIASWASQIEAEGIGPRLLAATIRRLGELDPDQPLSWPRFSMLVRRCRFAEPGLREDPKWEERRMREFRAKYPGARFPAAERRGE